jgi:hypothetical protein
MTIALIIGNISIHGLAKRVLAIKRLDGGLPIDPAR